MHLSVHGSSQHRHYLRQGVIASASYSPTPLDATNASRMTLLTGDFELRCARHIPRLALAPLSSSSLWPVGCPPRIRIHAPFLHRLAVHPCIWGFVSNRCLLYELQIPLQWHGEIALVCPSVLLLAALVLLRSTSTPKAWFMLPGLKFVWTWSSVSIFHEMC
jgi:hypothetical protein